jgi:YD repeat-containing protein
MKISMKVFLILGVLLVLFVYHSVYAGSVQYMYDSLNRLIRVEHSDGAVIEYTYDDAGNRTRVVVIAGSDLPVIEDIYFDDCISELCKSEISVSAYDPMGGDLTYSWNALDGGEIIGTGAAVAFDPPDSGPHPCPYHVEVTVTSSASGFSKDEIIEIYVRLAGDVDGNGVVNVLDKVQVRNHFGESGDPGWIDADVDCNGVVNVLDKVKVRNHFGQTGCMCAVP